MFQLEFIPVPPLASSQPHTSPTSLYGRLANKIAFKPFNSPRLGDN